MKSSKTGNELILLRENWMASSHTGYKRLTEQEVADLHLPPVKEKLSESIKGDLLNEIQDVNLRNLVKKLNEEKNVSNISVWKVPISTFKTNGNGRIYGRKLWENVINNQRNNWCGLYGLMDHPEKDNDPGSMKNICCVWHDIFIEGDIVYGICSFVGEYGKLISDILTCGGRAGTSTSGFGEVDRMTNEVDPDTFVCERASDFVINPSQGTFATIDCPHHTSNPKDFLKNINDGATMEFKQQQPIKENIRSEIMKHNAVKDENKTPLQENTSQVVEPVKTEPVVKLSKLEEKLYRKTIENLLKESEEVENPIARLQECNDILECFDEGLLPDLRESVENKIIEQKEKLEKLVEKVTDTEKTFGMDIHQFREAAERNTAQGILLKEQVTDYKALCESLATRNKQLKENIEELKQKLSLSNKLSEKKIYNANKELVNSSSELERLISLVEEKDVNNKGLSDKITKLSESNSALEKENGVLKTKLKEAAEIIGRGKKRRLTESKNKEFAFNEITKLKEELAKAVEANKKLSESYNAQCEKFDKLHESFENYKKEVQDKYNPVAHMLPNSTERVGKYLNLRENKGIEIENYWVDLKEQYGDSVAPFENEIRNAKTLREAVSIFLKHRSAIDPDFGIAQPVEFNYRNKAERAKMYEHIGMVNPIEEYKNSSVEQKNKEFLDNLKRQGLN